MSPGSKKGSVLAKASMVTSRMGEDLRGKIHHETKLPEETHRHKTVKKWEMTKEINKILDNRSQIIDIAYKRDMQEARGNIPWPVN